MHTFGGKEFSIKFPVQKKSNNSESELSANSNADNKCIVEIEGDIGGLTKDSLELYLENTKRSGGGDVETIDLDANPPRVIFCDPEGKIVYFFLISKHLLNFVFVSIKLLMLVPG